MKPQNGACYVNNAVDCRHFVVDHWSNQLELTIDDADTVIDVRLLT